MIPFDSEFFKQIVSEVQKGVDPEAAAKGGLPFFTAKLVTHPKFREAFQVLGDEVSVEDLARIIRVCWLFEFPSYPITRAKLVDQVRALERLEAEFGDYLFEDMRDWSRFREVLDFYRAAAESAEGGKRGRIGGSGGRRKAMAKALEKRLRETFPHANQSILYEAIGLIMQTTYPGELTLPDTVRQLLQK